jgi:hypothetical protein
MLVLLVVTVGGICRRASRRYDPEAAKGAAGVLNAEMKADLRAQHFKLGYAKATYESVEQER